MAFVPVDVYVSDTSPMGSPVSGVVCRVYTQDGSIFSTQTATDGDGHVGFMLSDGATYQLRFYKFGVSFTNPQYIAVVPAPGVNKFDVLAELVTPPVPADRRLCTAFGFFRTPDGSPAAKVDLHFLPKFNPLIVEGSAVLVERTIVRTDEKGYVEVNLFRNGQYDVMLQGMEDTQRRISVPDAPNVNLPDLLFPVVSLITFDPPGPYTLPVGEQMQLTPSVFTSDGNTDPLGNAYDVMWSSDNPDVLGLNLAGGVITLNGNSPGVANVIAKRSDLSIVRIPDLGIIGIPQLVTVQ
jgi:hypothetical protein